MRPLCRRSTSDDRWPDGDPALAAFAEDLRAVASGPAPEPSHALAALMAAGHALGQDPRPRRRKTLVRTALGSLAAKLALGVGVAAASVTAAGATGVLPDQAQHAVATVVSATTPFVLPDPSADRRQASLDDPAGSTRTTLAATGDDPAGQDRAANHGGCVSAAAQDNSGTGSHGKAVSSAARSDCGRSATSTTPPTVAESTTTSSTSTTVAGTNPLSSAGPGSAKGGEADDRTGDDANGLGSNGNGSNGNGSNGGGSNVSGSNGSGSNVSGSNGSGSNGSGSKAGAGNGGGNRG